MTMTDCVYTIGHSTHSTDRLIQLLIGHGVTALADVRSQPYSRVNPQFNRESLRTAMKTAGISYVFLGRELGARPADRRCYIDGQVQYDLLARTALFQEGLARVAQGLTSHRVALMCAEKDPLTCHRTILVCRHLRAVCSISAQHILGDGRLESHEDALTRLLTELNMRDRDLFQNWDDLVLEAYSRRGQQIAYNEKQPEREKTSSEVHR
jgi:uncharacterized protein (DUF488 family)